MWGALSDERTCLSFTIADRPRQLSYIYAIKISYIRTYHLYLQFYMKVFFTVSCQSPVPWEYLLFTVLLVILVTYVQYKQGLA
jgi:hypothetical protein